MVATPSKFRSREAVAAGVITRLDINRTGAITPPESTASMSQRRSGILIPASPAREMFVPGYRKDTRKTGGMSPTRIFASGVLILNNVAARRAYPAGDHEIFTLHRYHSCFLL